MIKEYSKEYFVKTGKKGAQIKHKARYEIIKKLAGYINKETQNKILKWPTKHLIELLNAYENKNNN